jgi:acyl-CoA reductase-like NAD-dependent aldehyde dehydrogenase
MKMVEDAVSKGAKLVAGGKREGSIMEATVLDHVKPDMQLYYEESFGPVASVIRASGDDALVDIANDTEYGLAAAVFSQDINRAMSVAQRIQSGIVHINGSTVADEPQIPFGGVKNSGYGRFGGPWGIAEFTDVKWLTIESEQHYPF